MAMATVETDFMHAFTQTYVGTIDMCSDCGNSGHGWCEDVSLDNNSITLKICRACKLAHGFDDTTDLLQLQKIAKDELHKLGFGRCDCGNEDLDQFKVQDNQLVCSRCGESSFPEDGENSLECPKCHNRNPDRIHLHEEEGELVNIECLQCGHGCGYEKELIKDISRLQPGDHIAWLRPYGFYHHALVVDSDQTLQVIEYGNQKLLQKPRVQMRIVDVKKEPGNMYRYNYPAVYEGDTAVIRAVTRLGEKAYDFVTGNCEHFVRWCREGVESCTQVCTVKQKMKELGKSIAGYFSVSKIGSGIVKLVAFAGAPTVADAAAEFASEGLEFLYKGVGHTGICPLFEALGAAAIFAFEAYNFHKDYKESKSMLKAGDIDQHEYYNRNIRSGAICIGRGVGATVGGILGEIFIPVPVVGSLIGVTVGGILGKFIGHYIGTWITHFRDKNKKEN